MPLANVNENDVLTVQVFGDNQQFKVIKVELLDGAEVNGGVNKVIGKDTEIIVKNQEDESEEESVDDLEKMMKELSLNNKVDDSKDEVKFVGFEEQVKTLKEILDLKMD